MKRKIYLKLYILAGEKKQGPKHHKYTKKKKKPGN